MFQKSLSLVLRRLHLRCLQEIATFERLGVGPAPAMTEPNSLQPIIVNVAIPAHDGRALDPRSCLVNLLDSAVGSLTLKYHSTENRYSTSRYFPELIMSHVMYLFTSIMVCELICRRCNSGRCMTGYLPSARNT